MLVGDPGAPPPGGAWRLLRSLPVLVAAMVLAVMGWRFLWFLTDDAFIAFRYVSNLRLGYGLVWNPPPFRPVEGYTSFLWTVLLAGVWRLTGIEPPRSACVLSLLCGQATLALAWRALGRLRLPPRLAAGRTALAALALLGICTNRTFLTWLSSGLETQLYNLCLTWWVLEAFGLLGAATGLAWGLRLSSAAALAALARPDGLLAVPATFVGLLAAAAVEEGREGGAARSRNGALRRLALSIAPLLAVPAHLIWRRATYAEWLPNTYYAKVPAPWPAVGWRYLAAFALENGVWVWLALAIAVGLRTAIRRRAASRRLGMPAGTRLTEAASASHPGWPATPMPVRIAAVALLLTQVLYYTVVVGGDHFEFRVFSYLIPLLFLSAVALVARLGAGRAASVALLAALLIASYPLPWIHWWRTRHLTTREETAFLRYPLAPDFPPPLRPIVAAWDGWEAMLIGHAIGMRQEEHKAFQIWMAAHLPSREEGGAIPWSGRPVIAADGVGVLGWVLPHVAVIDRFGLNDRVIARTPLPAARRRRQLMAHERRAPPGYVECFLPNVVVAAGHAAAMPRPVPLTDDRIRACENRDWQAQAAARSQ
jgi:arabinofuranosyltransferase